MTAVGLARGLYFSVTVRTVAGPRSHGPRLLDKSGGKGFKEKVKGFFGPDRGGPDCGPVHGPDCGPHRGLRLDRGEPLAVINI